MNILFIGNSFTYFNDLPKLLENITKSQDMDVCCDSVTFGGCYLHRYADENDEWGQAFRKKYADKKWDCIILQEQSSNPFVNYEDFATSTKKMLDIMSDSGAKYYIYDTWGYNPGSEKLAKTGLEFDDMTNKLFESYKNVSEMTGTVLVPVGVGLKELVNEHKNIVWYQPDDYHPSLNTSYFAACVFYKTIFGKSTVGVWTPADITTDIAKLLQSTADKY